MNIKSHRPKGNNKKKWQKAKANFSQNNKSLEIFGTRKFFQRGQRYRGIFKKIATLGQYEDSDIENFFNGIHYQNKSMNRSDKIKEKFSNDYVQENFYNDTKSTNGLEHFGNINFNPIETFSDVNVYTKWLKNNRQNYHNLNKIHVKNLFKIMGGRKLTKKEIPESFVILREGEEDIDKTEQITQQQNIRSSTSGCGK